MVACVGVPRRIGRARGVIVGAIALLSIDARAATRPVAVAVAPPAASTGLPDVGDLNGDGLADLAVATGPRGSIALFFGTGAGLPGRPTWCSRGPAAPRSRSPSRSDSPTSTVTAPPT